MYTTERLYICDICQQVFPKSSQLDVHMRTHDTEKQYTTRSHGTTSSSSSSHRQYTSSDSPSNSTLAAVEQLQNVHDQEEGFSLNGIFNPISNSNEDSLGQKSPPSPSSSSSPSSIATQSGGTDIKSGQVVDDPSKFGSDYKGHTDEVEEKPEHICPFCQESFPLISLLQYHVDERHAENEERQPAPPPSPKKQVTHL